MTSLAPESKPEVKIISLASSRCETSRLTISIFCQATGVSSGFSDAKVQSGHIQPHSAEYQRTIINRDAIYRQGSRPVDIENLNGPIFSTTVSARFHTMESAIRIDDFKILERPSHMKVCHRGFLFS